MIKLVEFTLRSTPARPAGLIWVNPITVASIERVNDSLTSMNVFDREMTVEGSVDEVLAKLTSE